MSHGFPQAIIDTRLLEPNQRHPAIFRVFDALGPGEHFVVLSDHDPIPLRYELGGRYGGVYTWEYRESGPELWRIEIGRVPEL